ncbi:MAG TPA: MFS transporter [Candidatus Paceibacterota bacterium]|nr:MFS transporter [Candidatus Paceibacterota bacterium]
MNILGVFSPLRRMTRDGLLLSFSAFFADLGYQGVAALFPLYLIFALHEPVYWYGIITAVAFGAGSFFAYIGGLAGDRFDKKYVAIVGNAFIPLMACSGLTHVLWLSALLFILGWWARYFRTPARRALLVQVTPEESRGLAFGVLHALDIGGGTLSALLALLFIALHVPIGTIILYAAVPLLISTILLFFVRRTTLYREESPLEEPGEATPPSREADRSLFVSLLIAATLYGFSFYNLGFPILTATGGSATTGGFELGVLAYAVYLGVSAVSGYALGAGKFSPLRSLWLIGYLPSALGSGLIALSVVFNLHELAFYLSVAILGLGMGTVETFEPTLVSSLIASTSLSRGMGFLSVSRSIGQFLSNLIMGVLFSLSRSAPYVYASVSALFATAVLGAADFRYTRDRRRERAPRVTR